MSAQSTIAVFDSFVGAWRFKPEELVTTGALVVFRDDRIALAPPVIDAGVEEFHVPVQDPELGSFMQDRARGDFLIHRASFRKGALRLLDESGRIRINVEYWEERR